MTEILPEHILLGRVVGAHGLAGAIRVKLFGDSADNLSRMPKLWLYEESGDAEAQSYQRLGASIGRVGEARVRLKGVSYRDEARELKGFLVVGAREHLEELPSGEHYWFELVGCKVEGHDGTAIGVVKEIWDTPGHDVLVVESETGQTHLLPGAEELLQEVDVEAKRIVIELIPGILDEWPSTKG